MINDVHLCTSTYILWQYVYLNLPSEYLGGKSLAYLEFGIPQLEYLRLLHDPSMVLYLLLGQGPTGGWHPAPWGADGISPKLKTYIMYLTTVQNVNLQRVLGL